MSKFRNMLQYHLKYETVRTSMPKIFWLIYTFLSPPIKYLSLCLQHIFLSVFGSLIVDLTTPRHATDRHAMPVCLIWWIWSHHAISVCGFVSVVAIGIVAVVIVSDRCCSSGGCTVVVVDDDREELIYYFNM